MRAPAWLDRALDALHLHDRKRLLGLSFILTVRPQLLGAACVLPLQPPQLPSLLPLLAPSCWHA